MWKELVGAFPIIRRWLDWKVGVGLKVSLGLDTGIGGPTDYVILDNLHISLNMRGLYVLVDIGFKRENLQ